LPTGQQAGGFLPFCETGGEQVRGGDVLAEELSESGGTAAGLFSMDGVGAFREEGHGGAPEVEGGGEEQDERGGAPASAAEEVDDAALVGDAEGTFGEDDVVGRAEEAEETVSAGRLAEIAVAQFVAGEDEDRAGAARAFGVAFDKLPGGVLGEEFPIGAFEKPFFD